MNEKRHEAIRDYEFWARVSLEGVAVLLFFIAYLLDCRLRLHVRATTEDLTILFVYWLVYHVCAETYRVYHTAAQSITDLAVGNALSALITNVIINFFIWIQMPLMASIPNTMHLWAILLLTIIQAAFGTAWAMWTHNFYFSHFPKKKCLVIAGDPERNMREEIERAGLSVRYDVQKEVNLWDFLMHEDECLKSYEGIFLSITDSRKRDEILTRCMERGVDAYVIPTIADLVLQSSHPLHIFHLPVYKVERRNPKLVYQIFKRFFDILLSALALVILSPVFAITAWAIHNEDNGPVFYRQTRLTKNGKTFQILKFRSMRTDAEKDGVARLSTGEGDNRVTNTGKFIRAHRIDELPQLINILKGDMSIVGPRPERPEIAAQYEKDMPEFSLRLQAKAGLTGYAQVYGKYNSTPKDKLTMDLVYIAHASLLEDFELCVATLKILFDKESTEGVAEGQTTAEGGKR